MGYFILIYLFFDQALGSPGTMYKSCSYYALILSGLTKGNGIIGDTQIAWSISEGWAKWHSCLWFLRIWCDLYCYYYYFYSLIYTKRVTFWLLKSICKILKNSKLIWIQLILVDKIVIVVNYLKSTMDKPILFWKFTWIVSSELRLWSSDSVNMF